MEETLKDIFPKTVRSIRGQFVKGSPKPAGSGAVKGQVYQRKRETAREIADRVGVEPLEYILMVIKSPAMRMVKVNRDTGSVILGPDGNPECEWIPITHELKMDAAKTAVKYLHHQLAATQITGADGGPVQIASFNLTELMKDPAMVEAAQTLALGMAETPAIEASSSTISSTNELDEAVTSTE